ncbi:MAG: hypothetical protein ACTSUE_09625 [Promethearchaeota archaeon]
MESVYLLYNASKYSRTITNAVQDYLLFGRCIFEEDEDEEKERQQSSLFLYSSNVEAN